MLFQRIWRFRVRVIATYLILASFGFVPHCAVPHCATAADETVKDIVADKAKNTAENANGEQGNDQPSERDPAVVVGAPIPDDFYTNTQTPEAVPLRFAAEWTNRLVSAFQERHDKLKEQKSGSAATAEQAKLFERLATQAGVLSAAWHFPHRPLGQPAADFSPLRSAARRFVADGFDDPLFVALTDLATSTSYKAQFWAGRRGGERADRAGYPVEVGVLLRDVGVQATSLGNAFPVVRNYRLLQKAQYEALIKMLDQPTPLSLGDSILFPDLVVDVANTATTSYEKEFLDRLAEDPKSPRADGRNWLAALTRGGLAATVGWANRGSSVAAGVAEDAWSKFQRLMDLSTREFQRAMDLRPRDPIAFRNAVAAGRAEGSTAIELQKLASARDPYSLVPWQQLRWISRPRWGGSLDAMLDVGLRAFKEGPPQSEVPWELLSVFKDILADQVNGNEAIDFLTEHRGRWSDPALQLLRRAYATADQGQNAKVLDQRRNDLLAITIAVSYIGDGPEKTAALMDALGLNHSTGDHIDLPSMAQANVDKRWDTGSAMAAAIADAAKALSAAYRGRIKTGELIKLADRLDADRAADDHSVAGASRHLRDVATALSLQRAWQNGESLDLLADELAGWRVSRGNVRVTDLGLELMIEPGGFGWGSRIVHTLDPGQHWECRFTIEASPRFSEPKDWNEFAHSGLLLTDSEARPSSHCPLIGIARLGRCIWRMTSGKQGLRVKTQHYQTNYYGDSSQLPSWTTGDFVVRRLGERVDIWQNGLPVMRDASLGRKQSFERFAVGIYTNITDLNQWAARLSRFEVRPLKTSAANDALADPNSWIHDLDPPTAGSDHGDHAGPNVLPPMEFSKVAPAAFPPGTGPVDTGRPLRETAALFEDAWNESLRAAGKADADWAEDARRLIRAESARVAAAFHPDLPRPKSFHPRSHDTMLAKRLLASDAKFDPLVSSLAKAVSQRNSQYGHRGQQQRSGVRNMVKQGHTALAVALLHIRSWKSEVYESDGIITMSRVEAMPMFRRALVDALTESAQWFDTHPDHARAMGGIVESFPEVSTPLRTQLMRDALMPIVQSGGATGRAARGILAHTDTDTAKAIVNSVKAAGDDAWPAILETASAFRDRARAHWVAIASDPDAPTADRAAAMNKVVSLRFLEPDLADNPNASPAATSALAWARAAAAADPERACDQTSWAVGLLRREPTTLAARRDLWDTLMQCLVEPARMVDAHPGLVKGLFDIVGRLRDDDSTPETIQTAETAHRWIQGHAETLAEFVQRSAVAAERLPRPNMNPNSIRGYGIGFLKRVGRDDLATQLAEQSGLNETQRPFPNEGKFGYIDRAVADPDASAKQLADWQNAFDAGQTVDLLDHGLTGWWLPDGDWVAEKNSRMGTTIRERPGNGRLGILQCPLALGSDYRIKVVFDQFRTTHYMMPASGRVGIILGTPTQPTSIMGVNVEFPEVSLSTIRRLLCWDVNDSGTGLDYEFRPSSNIMNKVPWKSRRYEMELHCHDDQVDVSINGTNVLRDDPIRGGLPKGGFSLIHMTYSDKDHEPMRLLRVEVQKLAKR